MGIRALFATLKISIFNGDRLSLSALGFAAGHCGTYEKSCLSALWHQEIFVVVPPFCANSVARVSLRIIFANALAALSSSGLK